MSNQYLPFTLFLKTHAYGLLYEPAHHFINNCSKSGQKITGKIAVP